MKVNQFKIKLQHYSMCFDKIRFYNMLVRERIFTLRTLRYYKDDNKRK